MPKKHLSNKINSKTFYVEGMHCGACELVIKQDISHLEGVSKADVSLAKSRVIIQAKSANAIPSQSKLNDLFHEQGYHFFDKKVEAKTVSKEEILKTLALAMFFIIGFFLIERSGIFLKFSLTSQSSLTSYFIFGLIAGVSSCAALVGGLLLSLSKKWNSLYNHNSKKSAIPFVLFNFSRIITFGIFGGLLGLLGSFFTVSIALTAVLAILVSILMLILGLQMMGIKWLKGFSFNPLGNNRFLDKNQDVQGKYIPLIVGALTFFVPCGFTLIAQTNALTSGSFYQGFLELLAFSLGTLPILALISFSSIKFYSNPAFSKKFSIFSGTLIVFFALYTFNSQLNVLGFKSLSDFKKTDAVTTKKAVATDGLEYQVMQMEAKGFEYLPKQLTIQSGVKTKWEIYNSGAVGCASSVYARGLYKEAVYLKPGLNTVEFTAPKPGKYKISCTMGMVDPITVTVL